MEKNELSKAGWLDKAEGYCARSEHCAADVRRKFLEWGTPSEIADEIEKKLYERDFLNDARFCRAYVHDKVAYQAWGRIKIQAGLRALQLPENVYMRNLRSLVEQRKKDNEEKRLRFLLQRGFCFEEIKKCK